MASITNLATALFELRNVSVLSAQAEDSEKEGIARMNKNTKVDYVPRCKADSAQTGRFMHKKSPSKTQTVTPGIVSLRR